MSTFNPERLAVVSLRAAELIPSVHFYRDVVGLSLLPHHDHRPAFELGNGCFLVIIQGEPPCSREEESAPFPDIAFAVEDIDQAAGHLKENGVETPWGIETNAGDRWIKFYDPAEYLVEFVQFN
jgi:catechol 2,3-dioxygenase-like lactoylglutathione lyase family enzyme